MPHQMSPVNNENFIKNPIVVYLTLTPIPILTPTPSSSPTPTPIPLVGYCLNVPVLFYHHIQPQADAISKKQTNMSVDSGTFDEQIGYLVSHGYNLITAKQLADALKNKSGLPAKSIVITVDDGYLDTYRFAYPVFKKYHVKASLMIPTGLLNGADYMTWSEIEEMQRSGLIYWVDHTWSHYPVNQGTAEKIKYEIDLAKSQLQDHTGQTIDIFTYPYGSFNDLSIEILTQEGFTAAFSTLPGNWQCDSFIMTLHRKRIGNSSMSYYGF